MVSSFGQKRVLQILREAQSFRSHLKFSPIAIGARDSPECRREYLRFLAGLFKHETARSALGRALLVFTSALYT